MPEQVNNPLAFNPIALKSSKTVVMATLSAIGLRMNLNQIVLICNFVNIFQKQKRFPNVASYDCGTSSKT